MLQGHETINLLLGRLAILALQRDQFLFKQLDARIHFLNDELQLPDFVVLGLFSLSFELFFLGLEHLRHHDIRLVSAQIAGALVELQIEVLFDVVGLLLLELARGRVVGSEMVVDELDFLLKQRFQLLKESFVALQVHFEQRHYFILFFLLDVRHFTLLGIISEESGLRGVELLFFVLRLKHIVLVLKLFFDSLLLIEAFLDELLLFLLLFDVVPFLFLVSFVVSLPPLLVWDLVFVLPFTLVVLFLELLLVAVGSLGGVLDSVLVEGFLWSLSEGLFSLISTDVVLLWWAI